MRDEYLTWLDENGIRSTTLIEMIRPELLRQTGIDRIPELIEPFKSGCFAFCSTKWTKESVEAFTGLEAKKEAPF